MHKRTRLAALFAAAGLAAMASSVAIAAPPTYFIDVSKTADPAVVPPSGGTVEFTVWVTATGTGFFNVVIASDPLAGCTLGAAVETSGDGDAKLEPGETWTYSCTVSNVTPGTENTATVNACHDQSVCTSTHDATDTGSVTVGQGPEVTSPPATEPPATLAPSQDVVVPTNAPGATEAATDTELVAGESDQAQLSRAFLLFGVVCFLIASIVVLTPEPAARRR